MNEQYKHAKRDGILCLLDKTNSYSQIVFLLKLFFHFPIKYIKKIQYFLTNKGINLYSFFYLMQKHKICYLETTVNENYSLH